MAQITTTANIGSYRGLQFNKSDGKPRLSFSAAETARIKDDSGQWVDGGTTWYNVTLFGGAAEALDQLIAAQDGKGKVIFSGRMTTRTYEHNGQQRESLDVVADSVGLVPRNAPAQGGQQAAPAAQGGWSNQPTNAGGWGNGATQTEPPF